MKMFGYVQRMLRSELPGNRRPRGRPARRFSDGEFDLH